MVVINNNYYILSDQIIISSEILWTLQLFLCETL